MHSQRLLKAIGIMAAALIILTLFVPVAAAGTTAALGPAVKQFLGSSQPTDKLQVIVTFRDGSGINKLKALTAKVEQLDSVPMTLSMLSADQIRQVASWPETRSVWNNRTYKLLDDVANHMIHADRVVAGDGLRRPYDGTGVGVAVIDSGVDATHPDLPYGAKVKKNFYIAADPLSGDEPSVYVEGSRNTDTEVGHGTHVASTIAGTGAASTGKYKGVAPGADIYMFRAGAGLNIFTWWAVRAFDWVIQNGPANNIRVVSNSWGGGDGEDYDPADPVNIITKAAYDHNIVVVFAAGNSGGPNMLGSNSVSPYVICVGAVDKSFKKASFSSTGRPGGDMTRDANGLYRPTIMAPGVDIIAAHASTGAVMADGIDTNNPFYTHSDGTSMATPHVAGVVALMLQARPQLSPQNVIDILEGTAGNLPDYERWQVGAGMLDAYAAVRAAEKGQLSFRPSTNGRTPVYNQLSSKDWTGQVLPAGYSVIGQTNALASDTKVNVGSGVDALYAEIEWAQAAESIYLQLLNPAGQVVEESAGLTDIGFVNFRTVVTTRPVAGMWTVRAIGRVNAVTDYRGFWGQYALNKPGKTTTPTNLVTTTTPYSGTVLTSADVVHDSQYFTFSVPTGATEVSALLDWAEANYDLDLYLYDSAGRLADSSTNGDINHEDVSVSTGTDPLMPNAGLPAGTWKLEVRGWLVAAPEAFNGTYSVTAPAP
jgi:serine protease AprX